MIEKKLKIDLSPLWNEQTDKFTIRFQDVNEKEKRHLAQRIKDIAKQAKIRNVSGPTVQTIYETLEEINPIIFSEYNQRNQYRTITGYRVFNINNSRALNGYFFNNLCQAIYLINCVKRELLKKEIQSITYLTCQNWDRVIQYVDRNYRIRDPEETERRNIIEEIGIEDIQRARRVAEDNGANRIPDGVFEEKHEEIDEIINGLVDHNVLGAILEDGTEEERTLTARVFNQNMRRLNRPAIRREPDVEALEAEIERIQSMRNTYTPGSRDWVNAEEDKITRINDLRRAIEEIRGRRRPERLADRADMAIRNFEENYNQQTVRMEPAENETRPFYGVDRADENTFEPTVRRIGELRPDFMIVDEVDPN
jgi:hypothetical protein